MPNYKQLLTRYKHLERQVCQMYRLTQEYMKNYKKFYLHDELIHLIEAREDRNVLGNQIDWLAMHFNYCNKVFSSRYVWDNVPLGSNKKGIGHLHTIRCELTKIQDYARGKQAHYRHQIHLQRVKRIRKR